jgi:hypothetical protein
MSGITTVQNNTKTFLDKLQQTKLNHFSCSEDHSYLPNGSFKNNK